MSALGLSRLMALFQAVDDLLGDGPPIAIRVGGGAAMMPHNPGRLTDDVDVRPGTAPRTTRSGHSCRPQRRTPRQLAQQRRSPLR